MLDHRRQRAGVVDVGGERLRRRGRDVSGTISARRRDSRARRAHLKPLARPLGQVAATPRPVMPVAPKTTTERSWPSLGLRRRGGGRLRLAEAVAAGGVGAGRLVDPVDDVARVGDAGEDEVVVVGAAVSKSTSPICISRW